MGNRIDLKGTNIRYDLVLDYGDEILSSSKIVDNDGIKVTFLNVGSELSKKINKSEGNYITIEFSDITNYEDREKCGKVLEKQIKKILELNDIKENDDCLIVGLGNVKSTPDSLGPKVIDRVMVTRHLFVLNSNVKDGIRNVSLICPGVMGNTGIESFDIIYSVVKRIHPKFLIVIDALAASSFDRVNKTIQLSDSGISPGSGIGNHRRDISFNSLGIKVITIGVPTVVYSNTIVSDTFDYLLKHIYYIKNNINRNKLIFKHNKNYLKDIDINGLSDDEKFNLSGLIGNLSSTDKRLLVKEVLSSLDYDLIVTPKDIDFIIDKLSDVISSSLNNSLHKSINNY